MLVVWHRLIEHLPECEGRENNRGLWE
jgi:hypothetical protein